MIGEKLKADFDSSSFYTVDAAAVFLSECVFMSGCMILPSAIPNPACHQKQATERGGAYRKGGGLREGNKYSQEGGMKGKQQEHKEEKERKILSVEIMKSLKREGEGG